MVISQDRRSLRKHRCCTLASAVWEATGSEASQVDLESGTIRIHTSKTEAGIRTIYIDPALMPQKPPPRFAALGGRTQEWR